ncbi:MAG: hypothetical protein EOP87_14855 [Verrucomicrobiaceae bacterium]|nr:MAG: hypothetical protein EOP87_14855 [Verrucomicrobiaceae bacterium]
MSVSSARPKGLEIMKRILIFLAMAGACWATASAGVSIDEKTFGEKLGGWTKRANQAAEYPLSGSSYRTYKPEVSPTPDGGIFVSVRIDHMRGILASDDHAILEITINDKGTIVSAQSNIAIQGRAITSDVIKGGTDTAKAAGVDRAVQIGTDLVADLSAKLLREKIVEAGRVSFPSVLRHNYNLLFQSIRTEEVAAVAVGEPAAPASAEPKPGGPKLEVKPYGDTPKPPEIPVKP